MNTVKVVIDSKPYSKWSEAGASETHKPQHLPPKQNYVGYWTFFEDPNLRGEFKLATNLYVPFPEKPEQVTAQTLKGWVGQEADKAPFYPDPELGLPPDAIWIPYTC
ncbi:MAG TPA: hypothetical protein DDZ80_23805 [Cyanobacteria bacterium UBA8803]|nr:hypothetical protein [Cyanobacteria bacterium UBA8803]